MSIFANNINPIISTNLSWNNIGYIEWIQYLKESYIKRFEGMVWFPELPYFDFSPPDYSKNIIKRSYSNKKHLDKRTEEVLSEIIKRVYEKYGVWLKYKVQIGKNKRIKSIYFYHFC